MEILVLHPGALGDVILSLPALNLLKEYIAGARITLCANLDYLAIVPERCLDRGLSLSTLPLPRLYGSLPLPDSDLILWTSFNRIVSWTGFGNDRFVGNLEAIHPHVKVASWMPARDDPRHVARIFADTLSPWVPGATPVNPVAIPTGSSHGEFAQKWLGKHGCRPGDRIIALHPGGGSRFKRWPLESFRQLGRRLLHDRAEKLLIIEGPAEPQLGRELAQALPASRSIVAESVPLVLLAALLSGCQAYVGNDSGVSHLAAAIGIFSVVLFGPTSPDKWAPLGPRVVVLRENSACLACGHNSSGEHRCLDDLTPEVVLRTILERLT